MKTLQELREALAAKSVEARSLSDSIKDDMSKDQVTEIEGRFDIMMGECDELDASIKRAERLAAIEARSVIAKRPTDNVSADEVEARSKAPEYAEVFEKQLRFGASKLNEEERGTLLENRAQGTTPDSAGGYTVPEGFSGELEKSLAIWGPMYDGGIVREISTTTGNALPWPTVDDTAKRGRLKAESASVDDDGTDDVVFGEIALSAYVYDTGMVRIPIELLQDSAFNMESLLVDLFSERLGRTANDVLTNGTGSSQPQGVLTGSTLGKTAAGTATITADELMDLFHSIDPAYRQSPRFRWMFNDATLKVIRQLKDGDGNYLWTKGDVQMGLPNSLFGAPYSINQAMPDLGTGNKPVVIGDMSKYVVRKVIAFTVLTLRERFAENFQVGMVGFKRFDGRVINPAAIKHLVNA